MSGSASSDGVGRRGPSGARLVRTGTTRLVAWRDGRLADPRHGQRTASLLGIALGVCFIVCFATGLISHAVQHRPSWFGWPARPAGLYRLTQGLHVATGIASVPLLFAKLWSVFPRLFVWPPVRGVLHALERLSLLPLVGGALFMLVTGVANIELWYPWVFFFPAGHFAVSFVVIGALVVHLAAKAGVARAALRRETALTHEPAPTHDAAAGDAPDRSRRRFLAGAAAASAGLVALTVGQTYRPLRKISLLAPRRPDIGPQGFPVNKTAREAGVSDRIGDDVELTVERGGAVVARFSLDDVRAMPRREATLPIACVEGWSASRTWSGVPVGDLLRAAGIDDAEHRTVTVESLQKAGRYRRSTLQPVEVADADTMLALDVDGAVLHPDHGYPLRLIAPNRPGVLQTKWVHRLVVA